MSATGRGGARSPLDFYETPAWCVDELLAVGGFSDFGDGVILDAGCGTGAISSRLPGFFPMAQIAGCDVEFRPEFFDRCSHALFFHGDFLKMTLGHGFPPDLEIKAVIMNPPYALAQEFIEHALTLTDGPVAALLRLNFLEGSTRSKWLSQHVPDVWVLANRPSFMRSVSCVLKKECGYQAGFALTAPWPRVCPMCGSATKSTTSDATAYAWMVWRRDKCTVGELRILR